MGQIIYLESRARPIRPTSPVQGDAQILFFLGVRYMRMDEYSAPTSDSPTATAATMRAAGNASGARAADAPGNGKSASFNPSILEPNTLCIWPRAHRPWPDPFSEHGPQACEHCAAPIAASRKGFRQRLVPCRHIFNRHRGVKACRIEAGFERTAHRPIERAMPRHRLSLRLRHGLQSFVELQPAQTIVATILRDHVARRLRIDNRAALRQRMIHARLCRSSGGSRRMLRRRFAARAEREENDQCV